VEQSNYVVVPLLLLTVVSCLAAAWNSYRRRRKVAGIREPVLWAAFAAVFLVFVVMKADRLTETLGMVGRQEARAGGVYQDRHAVQLLVVAGAALLGAVLAAWLSRHVARRWRRYRWTFLGAGIIVCFGLVRLVSLHELDALGGVLMLAKALVESAASVMAAWGALRRVNKLRMPVTPGETA
jgi:uncharacterized membrane protein YjfL (UPF0719 family)